VGRLDSRRSTTPFHADTTEAGAGAGGPAGAGDAADAGGVTRIRVVYPAGRAISIRGSGAPLSWDAGIDLIEMGGGVYEFTSREITSELELKLLLDGATWSLGPNYHVAPGESIVIAPHFTSLAGRVISLSDLESTILGNSRPVWAYLPASYDENTAADYAVVYMHDGQNLFDPSLAFGGNEWGDDATALVVKREK